MKGCGVIRPHEAGLNEGGDGGPVQSCSALYISVSAAPQSFLTLVSLSLEKIKMPRFGCCLREVLIRSAGAGSGADPISRRGWILVSIMWFREI